MMVVIMTASNVLFSQSLSPTWLGCGNLNYFFLFLLKPSSQMLIERFGGKNLSVIITYAES